MSDIAAFDIATTCGWARGAPGDAPASGSICFARSTGASENAVFGNCNRWISQFLEPEPRPDLIVLEAMLPGGAMRGMTTIEVRDRLAGLHGIIRSVAYLLGIYRIETADVGAVRQHFIGTRALKRHKAKREVLEKCHQLGWAVADDNAGDALATWHYACSLIKPELALETSPLFRRASK